MANGTVTAGRPLGFEPAQALDSVVKTFWSTVTKRQPRCCSRKAAVPFQPAPTPLNRRSSYCSPSTAAMTDNGLLDRCSTDRAASPISTGSSWPSDCEGAARVAGAPCCRSGASPDARASERRPVSRASRGGHVGRTDRADRGEVDVATRDALVGLAIAVDSPGRSRSGPVLVTQHRHGPPAGMTDLSRDCSFQAWPVAAQGEARPDRMIRVRRGDETGYGADVRIVHSEHLDHKRKWPGAPARAGSKFAAVN